MQENNRLWLAQNLLWLKFLAAAICLGILLLLFVVKAAPEIISFALQQTDSDQPTLAELQAQIAVERTQRRDLLAVLDSVKANADYSEQAILSSIQNCCQQREITIIGYDRVTSDHKAGSRATSYRFSVEGQFYSLTMLLADLESHSPRMKVSSLSFESKLLGKDKIRGVLVIEAGA